MPTLHQTLLALHAADSELDSCRRRIRALQAELADETALSRARDEHNAAQTELASSEAGARTAEKRLDDLNRTIAMLEKRLYDGSVHNVREATSVEEELRHRREERNTVEDQILEALERTEQAQARLSTAEKQLAAAEQARAARVPAIKQEGRALTERARAAQERRAALVAALVPGVRAQYELLQKIAPPAITLLHAGACHTCGVAVPTALAQKVLADELIHCPSCNRLLVEE